DLAEGEIPLLFAGVDDAVYVFFVLVELFSHGLALLSWAPSGWSGQMSCGGDPRSNKKCAKDSLYLMGLPGLGCGQGRGRGRKSFEIHPTASGTRRRRFPAEPVYMKLDDQPSPKDAV